MINVTRFLALAFSGILFLGNPAAEAHPGHSAFGLQSPPFHPGHEGEIASLVVFVAATTALLALRWLRSRS